MGITGKELAKKMGISESTVSVALNNRPGVSTKLRKKILEEARKYGYDFSKISTDNTAAISSYNIMIIRYMKQSVISTEGAFFDRIIQGIDSQCKKINAQISVYYLYEGPDFQRQLEGIKNSGCSGAILMATEFNKSEYDAFNNFPIPLILIDTYREYMHHDCILVNNVQGAFIASKFLLGKYKTIPGYIHSGYDINSFRERHDGYLKALKEAGLPESGAKILYALPTVEGVRTAIADFLDKGNEPQRCYFCDNDTMAISAILAFNERGYRVPEDVAICGYDNDTANYRAPFETSLTTISGPANQYWGELAVDRLVKRIQNPSLPVVKIELGTELIVRESA